MIIYIVEMIISYRDSSPHVDREVLGCFSSIQLAKEWINRNRKAIERNNDGCDVNLFYLSRTVDGAEDIAEE